MSPAPTTHRHATSRYPGPAAAIDADRSKSWLRRIRPIVVVHRRVFALGVIGGLIATLATVAVPRVIGQGLDALLEGDAVRPWVVTLIVLAVLRFAFGFIYRYNLFRAAHLIENDLRNLVYERLTLLSFSYWDRTQSGQVISRANTDIRSIQLLFAFAPLLAMQAVLLVVAIAVMLSIHVGLTFVALAPLPFVFIVGLELRNRVFPLSWLVQARMADLATIVDENIQGTAVVKAFAQEPTQVGSLAASARRLRWAGVTLADARARFAPVMEALPRLGLALVLLVGGRLAIDGSVAVGDLVTFNIFVVMLAAPFRMVGFLLIQWQRASAAALRVFELLDEEPEIVEPASATPVRRPAGRIEFRDVSFAYPAGDGTPILDGLDLVIEAGTTVAIVGRTGSGKSTIARLLPRFYDVDAGSVAVDGEDVRELALGQLRRAVNVVTDEPFLFATTIGENVAFADPDTDEGIIHDAIADAALTTTIADMPDGLATEVGERGATLSGGQRQRMALARSLLADPDILVLDDATSAIDSVVEARIHTALRRRREHRTTILIAHRLSTIALADRVVLLDGGRIVADGRHDELLTTEPRYAAILSDATTESSV